MEKKTRRRMKKNTVVLRKKRKVKERKGTVRHKEVGKEGNYGEISQEIETRNGGGR